MCVEFPKTSEGEQDDVEANGDKRSSRQRSVAKGFKDRSQK